MENNDIIKPQELLGLHTKILRKGTNIRKSLIAYILVKEQNGQLRSETGFVVYDKFDKQVFKGEHLELAVRTYNKLT
jgi:hypothetical protein